MVIFLLILHGLIALALLGAITHQAVGVMKPVARCGTFSARYAAVSPHTFPTAIIFTYVACLILGGLIYPAYRLDVRIPLEDMQLAWAVGLFEVKEHFGGIGLALLPLYSYYWKVDLTEGNKLGRAATTLILAVIVWFDLIAGHVLNNIRGL